MFIKKRKRFLSIHVCKRKMCIEGFCVNDAWKGILMCVSNKCIWRNFCVNYKCVLGKMKNLWMWIGFVYRPCDVKRRALMRVQKQFVMYKNIDVQRKIFLIKDHRCTLLKVMNPKQKNPAAKGRKPPTFTTVSNTHTHLATRGLGHELERLKANLRMRHFIYS